MEFQKLLEIIKKYKDGGEDYFFVKHELGNHHTGKIFEEKDEYTICSPELKKEARKLVIPNGDIGDCGICRVGTTIGEKWYEYEKGDGNKPDKFTVRVITPDEKRKEQEQRDREQVRRDREQAERDRQQAEWDRKEAERQRKERENPSENPNDKKKCAGCGKELDPKEKREISMGPVGSKEGSISFCPFSDCSAKYFREKDQQRENKPDNNSNDNLKCSECGDTPEGKEYWGWVGSGDKIICDSCSDKRPKKPELEIEKDILNALKNKLQNSSNPHEKENLQSKIRETENHIRELENKDKSNNSSKPEQPKVGHGKLFLAGAVILSAIILVSSLIISKRRKKPRIKD